ncbi:hypothetical protein IEO21_09705 [Rhodonia placenta]|uniref:CFEM domain-containing protein n=1 Tax=Rhodonia placenta TaxID=104341 RepID=A0A8H7NTW0_9APHY|nr:hypothetical protein IEO21_09705 [Postia placenta]
MFLRILIAFSLLLFGFRSVGAQSIPPLPTGLPGVGGVCIATCTTLAAVQYGCITPANLPCVCTSTAYWDGALSCLRNNCTTQDVQLASDLQVDQCLYVSFFTNPTSVSSAASRFSVAASSVLASESSVYSSISSAYKSKGSALSSALESYASSVSSVLSSEAASIAGIPQSNAVSPASTSGGSTNTANAAAGSRVGYTMGIVGHIASLVVLLSMLFGATIIL